MSILAMLAVHNEWANRRIFAACSEIDAARLHETTDGYDSVIGILSYLVQVEHSFFELAHGRAPQRIQPEELAALYDECARIDHFYRPPGRFPAARLSPANRHASVVAANCARNRGLF